MEAVSTTCQHDGAFPASDSVCRDWDVGSRLQVSGSRSHIVDRFFGCKNQAGRVEDSPDINVVHCKKKNIFAPFSKNLMIDLPESHPPLGQTGETFVNHLIF